MWTYQQKIARKSMSVVLPYGLKGLLPESILKQSVGMVGGIDFVPFGGYPKAPQVDYVNTWLVLPEKARGIWANAEACKRRKAAVEAGAIYPRSKMPEYCVALATAADMNSEEAAIEQAYSMLDSEQCANSGLVFFAHGSRVKRVVAGCSILWFTPGVGTRRLRIVMPLPASLPEAVRACFAASTEDNFMMQWCKGLCLLWAMKNPRMEAVCAFWQALGTETLVKGTGAIKMYSDYLDVMDECRAEVLKVSTFPSITKMEGLINFLIEKQTQFPGF